MNLTGHRIEEYRVELLNRKDESIAESIDGVVGGQLQWNSSADLPGGGTLDIVDLGQKINFSSDRIRVWYRATNYGSSDSVEWALGVYVMAAPTTAYDAISKRRSITLIDKLTVVRDDYLTETYQLAADSNIIDAVVAQIQASGETRISTTSSPKTLKNAMTWAPGTSRLTVINDLLKAAGYSTLWTDRLGQYRIEPYVSPADRAITYSFEEGEASIHSPDWSYDLNIWEATNSVLLLSQPDSNGSFWKALVEDNNSSSPTSIGKVGRTLNPIVQENVEASSQADLTAQAERILKDNSNVAGRLSVAHAMMPLWYEEAVHFSSQGMNTDAIITGMSVQLTPGSLMSAEWSQR